MSSSSVFKNHSWASLTWKYKILNATKSKTFWRVMWQPKWKILHDETFFHVQTYKNMYIKSPSCLASHPQTNSFCICKYPQIWKYSKLQIFPIPSNLDTGYSTCMYCLGQSTSLQRWCIYLLKGRVIAGSGRRRKRERDREVLPTTGLFPTCLQQLGPSQESGSPDLTLRTASAASQVL